MDDAKAIADINRRITASGADRRVVRIIFTATILREGWELDNKGWIVELDNGEQCALTTSHGGVLIWPEEEARESLLDMEAAAQSVRDALAIWPR